MAMQNKVMSVGLYLAAIFLLYGRTEVFPTNLYKANKNVLEADKRKPKQIIRSFRAIRDKIAQAGTMKKFSESLK